MYVRWLTTVIVAASRFRQMQFFSIIFISITVNSKYSFSRYFFYWIWKSNYWQQVIKKNMFFFNRYIWRVAVFKISWLARFLCFQLHVKWLLGSVQSRILMTDLYQLEPDVSFTHAMGNCRRWYQRKLWLALQIIRVRHFNGCGSNNCDKVRRFMVRCWNDRRYLHKQLYSWQVYPSSLWPVTCNLPI